MNISEMRQKLEKLRERPLTNPPFSSMVVDDVAITVNSDGSGTITFVWQTRINNNPEESFTADMMLGTKARRTNKYFHNEAELIQLLEGY